MENHRQIFAILARYERSASGLSVRRNPNLSPAIISGAKLMMHKPFYRSWSSCIPEVALKEENTFVAFHSTILLAGPQSDRVQQFWDGGGNFLASVSPGIQYHLCGYADLSFTVVLSDKAFADLQPLLEDAATKLAAEREADDKLREMVLKLRAQATGHFPPDEPTATLSSATTRNA